MSEAASANGERPQALSHSRGEANSRGPAPSRQDQPLSHRPLPGDSRYEADLRSRIGDAGDAIDRYKAKTAAAVGAGVFLLLLAAGAAYDLVNGKTALLIALNLSRSQFIFLGCGLGLTGLVLLALGAFREYRRDRAGEARLAQMEEELAERICSEDR